MTNINLLTQSLSVAGEDLTPSRKIAEAINKMGSNIRVSRPADQKYKPLVIEDAIARLSGNMLIIERRGYEESVENGGSIGGLCGFYMSLFGGYEITEGGVKLRYRSSGNTLHLMRATA